MGYWINTGDQLSKISVGNADCIWAIQNNQTILKKSMVLNKGWDTIAPPKNIPANTQFASIGCSQDGTVLLTDTGGTIYRWDDVAQQWNAFQQFAMAQIFVGKNNYVWALNGMNTAYQYFQEDLFRQASDTNHVEGNLVNLSVGDDGVVMAVNNQNVLFRYLGDGLFRQVSNNISLVSVASASHIIACTTGNVLRKYIGEGYWEDYQMIDSKGNPLPSGTITAISAGVDGTIYMLLNSPGATANVYVYIPFNFNS